MPDGFSDIVNEIEAIALSIKNDVVEGAIEVKDFFVGAYEYEATNLKPQFVKIVADCMAAAENAFTDPGMGTQKYLFAWSNVIAAAQKDAVEYSESAYDAAVQYIISERNKRRAALQAQPEPQPDPVPETPLA